MRDEDCVCFLQWCLPQMRLRWAGYRRVHRTVCKRIGRRLRELGLEDVRAYRARLVDEPAEWARLDAFCRIPISRFYRDRQVFDALGRTLLPDIAARAAQRGDGEVRCWSAGWASGEEVYTLRMVWDLSVRLRDPTMRLSILATDAEDVLLKRAGAGRYPRGALRDVPPPWLDRAFQPQGRLLCVKREFRTDLTFRLQDIRDAKPDGPFDLMLCRNLVFTYFEPALQRDVLSGIACRLRPGGLLVLGRNERLPHETAGFGPAAGDLPVYRKPNDATRVRHIGPKPGDR